MSITSHVVTSNAACELHVALHDGHALRVYSAKVSVPLNNVIGILNVTHVTSNMVTR